MYSNFPRIIILQFCPCLWCFGLLGQFMAIQQVMNLNLLVSKAYHSIWVPVTKRECSASSTDTTNTSTNINKLNLNGSNPFTFTSTPIGIIRAQPEGAPTLHCDFALGSVRSINSKNSLLMSINPLLKLNFLFGGDLKSPIEPQTGLVFALLVQLCSIVSLPFWAKWSLSHTFSTRESKYFQVVPGGSLSSCSFILRIWGWAGMLLIIYICTFKSFTQMYVLIKTICMFNMSFTHSYLPSGSD